MSDYARCKNCNHLYSPYELDGFKADDVLPEFCDVCRDHLILCVRCNRLSSNTEEREDGHVCRDHEPKFEGTEKKESDDGL